jgi:phytoene dehydrogenase-like protein
MNSRKDRFDVVVAGGGLGGLTAAGLLAKEGRDVILLEKEPAVGGHAAPFEWKGRRFDTALHMVMGGSRPTAGGEGIITDVLTRLDVADRCELVRIEPMYRAVFPDLDVSVSGAGREGYVASLAKHFPGREDAFAELIDDCSRIHSEALHFPIAPGLIQKLAVPLRFPQLFRNRATTLGEGLDRYGFDADAQSVLAALWLYLGLPPSRLSFPVWGSMTANMVEEGAFYCMGGFGRLAEALREGAERHGAEVRTGTSVQKIVVRDGAVRGVVTDGGDTFHAPIVISNVDARLTVGEMAGAEHFPADYRAKVENLRPSIFVVALYTAIPADLVPSETVHETVVFPSKNHDANFQAALNGNLDGVTVTIPTITDPAAGPEGEHLVVIQGMIPGDPRSIPDDAVRQLAECAAPVMPELPGHLGVGPEAAAGFPDRYALRTIGPIYGWERSPDQVGPRGLGNTTPIEGLYLCGHWSQPGAGVRTVIISGMRVCRLILGDRISKGIIG